MESNNRFEGIRTVHPNRLTRKGIAVLCIIAVVLVLLLLYHVPWPTYIEHMMPGAEVDLEGNVISSGVIVIEGWIYNYLFQFDRFQLTHLELPNREVDQIYEFSYYLDEMYPYTDIYMTIARIELPEYKTPQANTAHIFYPKDQSCWVIELTDRIFVGTSVPYADYGEIMDFWSDLIDGLIDN